MINEELQALMRHEWVHLYGIVKITVSELKTMCLLVY